MKCLELAKRLRFQQTPNTREEGVLRIIASDGVTPHSEGSSIKDISQEIREIVSGQNLCSNILPIDNATSDDYCMVYTRDTVKILEETRIDLENPVKQNEGCFSHFKPLQRITTNQDANQEKENNITLNPIDQISKWTKDNVALTITGISIAALSLVFPEFREFIARGALPVNIVLDGVSFENVVKDLTNTLWSISYAISVIGKDVLINKMINIGLSKELVEKLFDAIKLSNKGRKLVGLENAIILTLQILQDFGISYKFFLTIANLALKSITTVANLKDISVDSKSLKLNEHYAGKIAPLAMCTV